MSGEVHFVICVDTEGPLNETDEACVIRLNQLFGLELPVERETLGRLRAGDFALDPGVREKILRIISPEVRDWLGDWGKLEENLDYSMSEDFRNQVVDDEGKGLVLNWFVCDWNGAFTVNPRKKQMGLNGVFDVIWNRFKNRAATDPIYFHHHSLPFSRATHHPSRNWTNETSHITSLLSHLIDYGHFPACVRTPIMAPDISFFLDQYFPFDMSSFSDPMDGADQPDVKARRFVDWLGAPSDWSLYKPDPYDYRKPGAGHRWIGRSVQLGSRYGNLSREEMDKAFKKAVAGESVLMSCHIHDHSPMRKFGYFWPELQEIRHRHPDVRFLNATAVDAFRAVANLEPKPRPTLEIMFENNTAFITSDREILGLQPWFGFKTKDGAYLWDNMDAVEDRLWRYVFDEYTVPLSRLDAIGVAACDSYGNVATRVERL